MTLLGWAEIALILGLVFLAALPVGRYLATLLEGGRTFLSPVLAPVEGGIYAVCGIDRTRDMGWKEYVFALLC